MKDKTVIDTSDAEEQAELDRLRPRQQAFCSEPDRQATRKGQPDSDDDLDLFRIPEASMPICPRAARTTAAAQSAADIVEEGLDNINVVEDAPTSRNPLYSGAEENATFPPVFDIDMMDATTSETTVGLNLFTSQGRSASPGSLNPPIPHPQIPSSSPHGTLFDHVPMSPRSITKSSSPTFPRELSSGLEVLGPVDMGRPTSTPATSVLSSPKSPSPQEEGNASQSALEARNAFPEPQFHTSETDTIVPLFPEEEPGSDRRYGLRTRTNVQLKPFTVERIRYKRSLKGDPAAILKLRSPERRYHDPRESDEEFISADQTQGETVLNASGNGAESGTAAPKHPYFSLESDEDDRSIEALTRKLRRQERQKERQKQRVPRPLPLPLNNETVSQSTSSKVRLEDMPAATQRRTSRKQILSDDEDLLGRSSPELIGNNQGEISAPSVTASIGHDIHFAPFLSDHPVADESVYHDASPPPLHVNDFLHRSQSPTSSVHSTPHPEETEYDPEPIYVGKKRKNPMKVLKRMMPHFWIKGHLADDDFTQPKKRPRPVASPIPSSPSDADVQPGSSITRPRSPIAPFIVDAENEADSSESDLSGPEVRAPVIDLEEEDETQVPIVDVDAWVSAPRFHPTIRPVKPNAGARLEREPDLIDRMLSRSTRDTKHVQSKAHRLRARDSIAPHRRHRKENHSSCHANSAPHRYATAAQINVFTCVSLKRRTRKKTKSDGLKQLVLAKGGGRAGPLAKPKDNGQETYDETYYVDDPVPGLVGHFDAVAHHRQRFSGLNNLTQSLLTDVWPSDSWQQEFDVDAPQRSHLPASHVAEAIPLQTDCGIKPLPERIAFEASTYLGSGRLRELELLLERPTEILFLPIFADYGLLLGPSSESERITESLPVMSDKLYEWATNDNLDVSDIEMNPPKKFARFTALYLSRLVTNSSTEHAQRFIDSVLQELRHLNERFALFMGSQGEHSVWTGREFDFAWTLVELIIRVIVLQHNAKLEDALVAAFGLFESLIVALIRLLLDFGVEKAFAVVKGQRSSIAVSDAKSISLQCWVCILHILPGVQILAGDGNGLGTGLLWKEIENIPGQSSAIFDPDRSERMWHVIFSLCGIAQFSSHGVSVGSTSLQPSWNTVNEALKLVNLKANEEEDKLKPSVILRKRDQYTRLVTSRCFLLCSRWKWSLHDGVKVLFTLNEIFRSRNFANLENESADFPHFVRLHRIILSKEWQREDTAHASFMKSVIRFSDDASRIRGQQFRDTQVKKLLSVVVPVNSLGFTRDTTPWARDLSKLYNRYTACFVAILLCPESQDLLSHANAQLRRCKTYTNFSEAEHFSRVVTIRCLMEMAILYRHLSLSLDELFLWSDEMLRVLLSVLTNDALQQDRSRILIDVQMIIAAATIALQTSSLTDTPKEIEMYPDKCFLDSAAAYVEHVPKQLQTNDWQTAEQIRKLVETFLSIRRVIVPRSGTVQENQESQDEYGSLDLNMDDPALLQALGLPELPVDDRRMLDHALAQTMDKIFAPYFYARVCKQVEEDVEKFSSHSPQPFHFDFQWIDCWVRCIEVIVANDIKGWDSFVYLSSESWTRIADGTWRRRIGMRFLFQALQEDPRIFKDLRDQCLTVFFECLVSPEVVMEHDYVSLIMTHVSNSKETQLLSEIRLAHRIKEGRDLTAADFVAERIFIVEDVCTALSRHSCGAGTSKPQVLFGQLTQHLNSLVLTMQIHLQAQGDRRPDYMRFCAQLVRLLAHSSVLSADSRFKADLTRVRSQIPIIYFD